MIEEYDSEDEEDEEELQRMQAARDRLATVAKLQITHTTTGKCGLLVLALVLVMLSSFFKQANITKKLLQKISSNHILYVSGF